MENKGIFKLYFFFSRKPYFEINTILTHTKSYTQQTQAKMPGMKREFQINFSYEFHINSSLSEIHIKKKYMWNACENISHEIHMNFFT